MPRVLILLLSLIANILLVNSFNAIPGRTYINKFRNNNVLRNMIDCPEGEFENLVIKSKIPVVVDFFANWCGPCKLVGPIFKQVSEDFPSDKVRFVKVDTDIHEATVEKYNIQGLPLFGVFIDGEIVLSHSGALNRDALRDLVTRGILHGHQL